MCRLIILISLFFSSTIFAGGMVYNTKQDYVNAWYQTAVQEMIRYKIPASITLAQGIFESNYGNSDLARLANNHFGIKCHNWDGAKVYQDDDKANECFRKYPSANLSYEDHSKFLVNGKRYASLFDLDIKDYKGWARGLKAAGYATNPQYANRLIATIEELNLEQYDNLGAINHSPTINLSEENVEENQPNISTEVKTTKSSKSVKSRKAKRGNHSLLSPSRQNDVIIDIENNQEKLDDLKKRLKVYSPFRITNRVVKQNNGIKYITVQKGDTYYKIAREFELTLPQLYRYNSFDKNKDVLSPGDIVYLQPKRGASKDLKSVVLKEDMSAVELSQKYGVKLHQIMKRNNLTSKYAKLAKGNRILL